MQSTFLIAAIVLGAPAIKDKPQPAPSIVGEWKVESRTDSGRPSGDDNIWIFTKGETAEIRDKTRAMIRSELTYTVSTKDQPNHLDFMESQGNGKSLPRQGIYKIEGDTLTFSFTCENIPRPTSFESTAQNGYCVITLKRIPK